MVAVFFQLALAFAFSTGISAMIINPDSTKKVQWKLTLRKLAGLWFKFLLVGVLFLLLFFGFLNLKFSFLKPMQKFALIGLSNTLDYFQGDPGIPEWANYFNGAFVPTESLGTIQLNDVVRGSIPESLDGAFLRVGPSAPFWYYLFFYFLTNWFMPFLTKVPEEANAYI